MSDPQRAYDPIPHLAALLAGLRAFPPPEYRKDREAVLTGLLNGPVVALVAGLGLGREHLTAEDAIRAALAAYITRGGRLITSEEIEGWVAEAERGYDICGECQVGARPGLPLAHRMDCSRRGAELALPAPLAHDHDHRHAGGRYGIPGFRHSHPHEHARGSESHDHDGLHDSQGHSYAAPPPHPELGPASGHQADGPANCRRCQMIRDNAHWLLPENPEG